MSTVDKAYAECIIEDNGTPPCEGELQCTRIVRFIDKWDHVAYGLTYEGEDQEKYLRETDFVQRPTIYWEYKP